jgi:hypothetical protein
MKRGGAGDRFVFADNLVLNKILEQMMLVVMIITGVKQDG